MNYRVRHCYYDSLDALLRSITGNELEVVSRTDRDTVRARRLDARFSDHVPLPCTQIKTFYEEQIRWVRVGEPVANLRFQIGTLHSEVSALIRTILPHLPEGANAVRISGRALKHIEEQRPKVAAQIVDLIGEIVLRPDEVLPHNTNPSRAFLIKKMERLDNTVAVLEVAEREDGLDVVTIYTAPDRSLRKVRKAALRRLSGPEGQQPVASTTDSPHPPLRPSQGAHAAADFLRVSPDKNSVPPPAVG